MCNFINIIKAATKKIPKKYFQLPVVDKEDPIYRERVYCYELYHQMRSIWPIATEYSLAGELDKSGAPRFLSEKKLKKKKPDFLIHISGEGNNKLIIEVKSIITEKNKIKKDLETLTAFINHADYKQAILLIYGDGNEKIERLKDNANTLNNGDSIDLSIIELWHHSQVNVAAQKIEWNKE